MLFRSSKNPVKEYKINPREPIMAAASNKVKNKTDFAFKTAESFLNSLNKKSSDTVDLSRYKPGVRVFHKKFGEGTINIAEQEGDDLKVDIDFDKVGHKRLMAKFAKLEII